MALSLARRLASITALFTWTYLAGRLDGAGLSLFQYEGQKGDVYNILWALVFGFATLNILGLAARRLEPRHSRLSFGEMLAVMVVMVSVFLLGWEMLYVSHILPIKLQPHY